MKLNASEMISRHTSTSSRSLLAFSATVFLIYKYDLSNNIKSAPDDSLTSVSNWNLFGTDIPNEMFGIVVFILLCFFLLNHVFHWYSDYTAFRNWFSINSVPIGMIGTTGTLHDDEPTIEGVNRRLRKVYENAREIEDDKIDQESLGKLERSIDDLIDLLSRQGQKFDSISRISKFHIYVWYLGFPVIVWFLAMAIFLINIFF